MTAERLGHLSALAALPILFGACSWFTDFKRQPSIQPWGEFSADSAELKGFRGQPAGSVSTNGTFAAGFAVSNDPLNLAALDSMATIQNPVLPDERSLAAGRKYFAINCAVCHGDAGDGNGALKQLNPAYGFSPSLLTDLTKGRSDGFLWGKMRNGGPLMPSANRIEEMDRWDVVNYVRGLQGKLAAPVPTGPVGRPGETGDRLPGFTRLGPTVPSKYFHPAVTGRPAGAHGAAAADNPETRTP